MRRLALAILLSTAMIHAEPTAAARVEAKERFDRGVSLFDKGDKAGALAEFKRAYELVPNAITLFDLALVYGALGRSVDAADAWEKVLADPAGLSPKHVAVARKALEEQTARIAEVSVTANIDAARIDVDGIDVGATPLPKPLRVVAGTHVVGAIATGHAPSRKEITVAGRTHELMKFELIPFEGRLAHLTVQSELAAALVFVDNARIGITPLSSSIALVPGEHRVELRRPGYRSAVSTITLADGARGELTLTPEEDPGELANIAGTLVVSASETSANVFVDGRPRGAAGVPLRLAPGAHVVRIERAGFLPTARDVVVDTGRTLTVQINLEPTAETRLAHDRSVRSHRVFGYSFAIAGVATLGAGLAYVLYNASAKASAEDAYERIIYESEPGSGRRCDPKQPALGCRAELDARVDAFDAAKRRDVYGYLAAGAGLVSSVVGVVLLATAADAHKYDRIAAHVTPLRGGVALSLAFQF
jgi:hypothetical protein